MKILCHGVPESQFLRITLACRQSLALVICYLELAELLWGNYNNYLLCQWANPCWSNLKFNLVYCQFICSFIFVHDAYVAALHSQPC